ncbi:MAG: ornithine cyclodeaminase family protein [Acidimicrobiia bacterium]|nr:ornithine cyclodeaminase family protein [Acidimicrobiia bacterium]
MPASRTTVALHLTEQDVTRLLSMPMAIEAVEEAFRQLGGGQAENLPRRRLHSAKGMMHLMAASLPSAGYFGYKTYTVFPESIRFTVCLLSSESGELLAVLEASQLGQIRTGAASGVATRWMARVDTKVIGIVGTGRQAYRQVEAVCQVRPVNQVVAYSRTPERLAQFCKKIHEQLGVQCHAAKSADEVAEAADVLVTITNSASPVFRGECLKPGTHINAAGSNFLIKRELDETCIRRCRSIVVDSKDQARMECGEFLGPLQKGRLTWDQIRELSEVVTVRSLPRTDPKDITLFKSLGVALEDVAVAAKVYQLARAQEVGRTMEFGAGLSG